MSEQIRSGISSWEEWVEELISLPEEEQFPELLEKTKEQYLQIQTISSEKSELQSLVQELQSQIQQLSGEIAKQNESDKVLQAVIKKKKELKTEREWVERQMEINKLDRQNNLQDKNNIHILINNRSHKVIEQYKNRFNLIIIIFILTELVLLGNIAYLNFW